MGTDRFKEKLINEKGVSAVQTAFALPVFLFLLYVGASFLIGVYKASALQNALSRTVRQAILDADEPNPILAIKNQAIETADTYGVKLRHQDIRVCRAEDAICRSGRGPESAAGSERFVAVDVDYPIKLLYNTTVKYSLAVIARNEPF